MADSTNRFRARFRDGPAARPLVIAHRGGPARAPENTLEAARRAREAGADAWEFDVQLTRDGVPIVIHDDSLSRTTDVGRRHSGDGRAARGFLVADFDWAEIARLDAGSRFRAGVVRVPTLRAALELTDALDWLANIELKSVPTADPLLLDAVLAAIDATGTADRVLISSFDHAELARVARDRPALPTGVLTATPLDQPAAYVRDFLKADCYHPSAAAVGADATAYRRRPSAATLRTTDFHALRARGVPVLVYTVNSATLARHLARAGASGLFTDHPRRLRALFGP